MKNACGDAALSPDMQSRYHDRYQKCQDDLLKSEKVYRSALDNLYLLKKNYVSHMNDVSYADTSNFASIHFIFCSFFQISFLYV